MLQRIVAEVTDPLELAAEHNGRRLSEDESALLFRLRALRAPEPPDGEDRRAGDFPLLRLQPFWVHADPPIARMTQCELMDTVWGLQWLLLSDIYETERPAAWFEQFEAALELARARAFYLVQHEGRKAVLDAGERYAEPVPPEAAPEPEFDYDSDEERRAPRRPALGADVLEWLDPPHRATEGFVRDMDAALRSMDEALFVRWRLGGVREVPRQDLRELRRRVFQEFREVKEQTALGFRREWLQRLLVHPAYAQVHVRWNPHDRKVNPRAVLVKKHEALAHLCVPTSVEDIVAPPPRTEGRRGAVDMRMNTDACLFYVSAAAPDDDFAARVFRGAHPADVEPGAEGIWRVPALQRWVVAAGGGRWAAESFAAALLWYRERTGDAGLGKRVLGPGAAQM